MDWLILRLVFSSAWNITDATNKGVGGWEGVGRVGGLMMLSDTGDQVVCRQMGTANLTILQGEQRQVEQFGTTCHLIKAPQWLHRVCDGPAWLDRVGDKPSVKADLLTYCNCVTVSGQCLSVAIITSNKMDFNSCAYMVSFPKSSHIWCYI